MADFIRRACAKGRRDDMVWAPNCPELFNNMDFLRCQWTPAERNAPVTFPIGTVPDIFTGSSGSRVLPSDHAGV